MCAAIRMETGSKFQTMSYFQRVRTIAQALLPGLLLVSLPVLAGELKPPLQALRFQNYNLVVAERLDQPVVDSRIQIRIIERIKGDSTSPEFIDLIVQGNDDEILVPGEPYLLFYSDIERVNFKPRTEARRPDRRRLLHIEGADPAVFANTPQMRALLAPGHVEVEQGPGYRDVVIGGMRSEDPGMVDLWTAEWAIRISLFPEIRPGEEQLLGAIIENPAQRPSARARILQAASERIDPGNVEWLTTSVGNVLDANNPADLAENTVLSQVIYASLRVARKYPEESNSQPLEKWLASTPAIAEAAAVALRQIAPDIERSAVENAIQDQAVPEQTRTFLTDHLRRLKLAESKAASE